MKNPLNLPKYFPYIFRRRFKGKYIIIESDDWGMQQSINDGGIEYLKSKYGKDQFTRWTTDALESVDDIIRIAGGKEVKAGSTVRVYKNNLETLYNIFLSSDILTSFSN